MTPTKSLAAQIDAAIENDIRFWIEEVKERELEQTDLWEDDNG